eukprot:1514260-Prymnesium_polylepis.1
MWSVVLSHPHEIAQRTALRQGCRTVERKSCSRALALTTARLSSPAALRPPPRVSTHGRVGSGGVRGPA